MKDYSRPLPFPTFIIPPSIDPFSDKNRELEQQEVETVYATFGIDLERPVLLQVSRFDRFKDPKGVITAFQLAKQKYKDLQLVLVGGPAIDDPEGAPFYQEVMASAKGEPNIFVLNLPSDAHRIVNALQRGATIILQKSIKEGFGLTVTEALWKKKPVIGGNTGGIRLQVLDHETGLLVNSPEQAADAICYLLQEPQKAKEFGLAGRELVKEEFLITRHIKDYLSMMRSLV